MIRILALAVALAAAPLALAQTPTTVSGYRLDGSTLRLPADLKGAPTLLIIQNAGLDQTQAHPWREAATRTGTRHLTLVVMGERDRIGRVAGAGRLRADVDDESLRAVIAPVFVEAVAVRQTLGLPRTAGANQVVLLDDQGRFAAAVDAQPAVDKTTALTTYLAAVARGERPHVASLPAPTSSSKPEPARTEAVAPTLSVQVPAPAAATDAAAASAPTGSAALTLTPDAPSEAAEPEKAPGGALSGLTLTGLRRHIPADAKRLVLAVNADHVADLSQRLATLLRNGQCTTGCLGLVAMGESPRPTRAIAAGRLRAQVQDEAMRARIMPVYLGRSDLFARFSIDTDAPVFEVVLP